MHHRVADPVVMRTVEVAMDFIERIFGISPDGGSGSLEILLLVAPLVALALLYNLRRARRSRRSD
jgi:hypothetical protein